MNSCNFIGRIGRDAELRQAGGKPVASWSLAVDVGYGQNKSTVWLDCSLWGERAEKLAGYIRKGDRIGVHGEIGVRQYESNGQEKTSITLRVADVTLLGEKRADDRPSVPASREKVKAAARQDARDQAAAFEDDDIPF